MKCDYCEKVIRPEQKAVRESIETTKKGADFRTFKPGVIFHDHCLKIKENFDDN